MLTLVIGGAASGKSAYAEHLAVQSGGPRYYLATMQVWDAECAARVAKHRAMRAQKQFATVECPQNLHLVRLPQQGTALLEDLGNLAANELYRPDGSCLPPKQAAEKMLAGIEQSLHNATILSSSATRYSAAGRTMPGRQTFICRPLP